MPDYKMLYYKLFCAVSDEIEKLKKIQCELEELVMDSDDVVVEELSETISDN